MGDRVAGAGFEGVRERVAEIQDRPPALELERIGEDDARLECGARVDHLFLLELPDLSAGQETCLHHLGHARAPLRVRKRSQEAGVDEYDLREVEDAGKVLSLSGVDAGLPADRRIDHTGERRRNRGPFHAAFVRCRREAGDIGGRPTPACDEHAVAVELQLSPDPLDDGQRLRLLPRGHRKDTIAAFKRVQTQHPFVDDDVRLRCQNRSPDEDAERGKRDALRVVRRRIHCLGVDRPSRGE